MIFLFVHIRSIQTKYQFLISKRKSASLKHCNDSKAFFKYSNDMGDIYGKITEYNPNIKRKQLIVFDNMIGNMLNT